MLTESAFIAPFACQRCKQPLRMDESFANLAPSAYDMIASLSDRNNAALYPYQLQQLDPNSRNQPSTSTLPLTQSNIRRTRPFPPSGLASPVRVANHTPNQTASNSPTNNRGTISAQSTNFSFNPAPTESFVVLSESVLGAARAQLTNKDNSPLNPKSHGPLSSPNSSSSHQLDVRLAKLVQLLSQNPATIEHPLCTECTDKLLELTNNEMQAAKSNRDRYAVFERELNRERALAASSPEGSYETCQKIKEDIEKLKVKESEANMKLEQIELECERIEAELQEIDQQEAELDIEEEQFWEDYNQYELDQMRLQSQFDSISTRYQSDRMELEKLNATNVYKDAFCIGCEAGVGTINGLRLGRLTDVPVEWVEINAAWGHTALLLQTICKRINFTLDGYRLIPMGSFSRIERTKGDKTCLELFGSDDFTLVRVLHNRRFDNAMIDFLECLKQVLDHLTKQNKKIKIPFRIHKDKIGESSIKLSFSSDEVWTSALRYVLFTLKIINVSI
ncbi:hypothetical protein O181_030483 [Austropuccinia psidii MF-1]|uniref:Autophagy-related protein 6 n=1 Tax=Austropuccinia psidii MF-1 TaxID=1389203 RepID=A0A9Q3CXT5_9BASI|nr:hypothetical protein [Austropuccinia psidii MF-1]